MPPANRAKAEREAERLLERLTIDIAPTPVDDIIHDLGAQIVRRRMDSDVSGMTYRHGDQAVVGLNSSHHPRRQRFTGAHEIGHLVLHPGRPLTVDSSIRVNFRDAVSSQATDSQEIEANAFAAALLMPTRQVLSRVELLQRNGVRGKDKLITELAKQFDVSPEAMGYRLINLGISS